MDTFALEPGDNGESSSRTSISSTMIWALRKGRRDKMRRRSIVRGDRMVRGLASGQLQRFDDADGREK
jgi:hypothetical protein